MVLDTNSEASTPILPAHIDETIRAIARLHAQHHDSTTPLQRSVDRLTSLLGQPAFVGIVTVLILSWIGANLWASSAGYVPIDPSPFNWLQAGVSFLALYLAMLILTTQRREEQLSQLREQLTLELAILSEQKTAKVIQLLEELRRDNPLIPNRIDREAEEMAIPADPQSVLDAIKDTHAEMAEMSTPADISTIWEEHDNSGVSVQDRAS